MPPSTVIPVLSGLLLRLVPAFRPFRHARILAILTAIGLGLSPTAAPSLAAPAKDFTSDVELAPFVVNGTQLSISVHARSKRDRRYAEDFGEEVVKIVYDAVTESTGKGLIIIGKTGEPHPIFVFRRFLEMAKAGQLDPAVAARAPELFDSLKIWEDMIDQQDGQVSVEESDDDFEIDFDKIITALPLPLEGIGAQLYQIAWAENLDPDRVEAKMRALKPADFEGRLFAHFDWVFYLPPRNAFDVALKQLIAKVMEKEKMGFFQRTAVRGAMLVFKPAIRKAIESFRSSLLFTTILRARTEFSEADIHALNDAYLQTAMPDFDFDTPSGKRAITDAIREQVEINAEEARNPFTAPPELTSFAPADYVPLLGKFAANPSPKSTHQFNQPKDGTFTWGKRDGDAQEFLPAGPHLLVSADGTRTLEFLTDANGRPTSVTVRGDHYRQTLRFLP